MKYTVQQEFWMIDRSNGYEEHAETFMRARNASIGRDVVREWARAFRPGSAVLELGCGHGVISEVLLEAGVTLYAADSSPTLLRHFRERFPAVEAECATAEESAYFGRKFDGVVAWGLIFLLQETAQRVVLARAANALAPGGRLLFTATHERAIWRDGITGQESCSLGATEYEALLRGLGLEIAPGCFDTGDNYYFFASKRA